MWWLCCVAVVLCATAISADDLPWWRTAVFYQVYPRSFKDSDGDGVGDLKGITQAADYFKEIGVDAIWLSPIYTSPMADFGYDISNYMEIASVFGTMDDFDALIAKMKENGVKVVLDFVPNHSSDEHPWFQESLKNTPDYRDFYVWQDPVGYTYDTNGTEIPIPPNNWISVFSGSAWKYRPERKQFYLHKFVTKQPDLNYRDPNVVSNMTAVLEFWLGRGVDGFRMDAVQQIYENASFPNETAVPGTAGNTYYTQEHGYEMNQDETFSLLLDWADVVNKWVQKDGKPRAIFLEVYDTISTTMQYYGTGTRSLEFPFNFNLIGGDQATRPAKLKTIIDQWMAAMPQGGVANWVIGNHDNGRVADRYGPEMVDAMNLLTGILPGIKVTYNGEEIGMRNTYIRWDQTVDPSGLLLGPYHYQEGSRDPERTPMQWDDTLCSGFSSNDKTWLPVNPNYWWLNVQAQRTAETSHLKVFQAMAQARKDPVLQESGNYKVIVPDNDTLIVVRSSNSTSYVLIINMGSELTNYTSQNLFASQALDMNMTVVVGSVNSGYKAGMNLQQGSLDISLRPKAALLLKSGSSHETSPASRSGTLTVSLSLLICALALGLLY